MLMTLLGSVMLIKLLQDTNALAPMLVTLLPIAAFVKLVQK